MSGYHRARWHAFACFPKKRESSWLQLFVRTVVFLYGVGQILVRVAENIGLVVHGSAQLAEFAGRKTRDCGSGHRLGTDQSAGFCIQLL